MFHVVPWNSARYCSSLVYAGVKNAPSSPLAYEARSGPSYVTPCLDVPPVSADSPVTIGFDVIVKVSVSCPLSLPLFSKFLFDPKSLTLSGPGPAIILTCLNARSLMSGSSFHENLILTAPFPISFLPSAENVTSPLRISSLEFTSSPPPSTNLILLRSPLTLSFLFLG